jgi:uncharacterized hydrophobic protein (TIGR00271 family)
MSTNSHIKRTIVILRQYFSLGDNKENEPDIITSIRRGVEFKGTNLWILVFAIFLASIGLNVNSTAIIIGAMLISPLMGPIMGIGLGVGIYDFELIKKAGKNLLVAVLISIAASSLYFLLTPLTEAQSELLARTTPTIWDVFIALFGGLAGIIAGSSKEKGNVIPGVAIATALMPPLCTAGYGLANGNMLFFFGAIYLFFINSVFICLATYITVRILKFRHHEFVNPKRELVIKRYIYLLIVITIIPSIYLAYRIVNRSIFEQNARKFIQNELSFSETQIISKSYKQESNSKTIDITLIGKPIDSILINHAKEKLPNYKLIGTNLIVRQGSYDNRNDITSIKTEIIEELYKKNDLLIKSKDEKIRLLENELSKLEKARLPIKDITNEALAVHKNISEFSINNGILYNAKSNKYDTVFIAYLSFVKRPSAQEAESLNRWLKARLKSEKVKLIIK